MPKMRDDDMQEGGAVMRSIFSINEDLLKAYDMAESGEYDEEAIAGAIELLEMELEDKADNYAYLIKQIKGNANIRDKEIERLQKANKREDAFIDRLKANLQAVMVHTGKLKFKTNFHSFYIQKSPAALHVFDQDAIPEKYLFQPPPAVNNAEVKEALKRGEEVPGAALTQGETLRIR